MRSGGGGAEGGGGGTEGEGGGAERARTGSTLFIPTGAGASRVINVAANSGA